MQGHGISNDDGGLNHEETSLVFYLSFMTLMLVFFFGTAFIEKVKPPIGHETGLTVITGVAISFLFWEMFGTSKKEAFQFSADAFFNFYLPPIIFNSGFNMRKKKFFQNLGNITIFGIFITFVTFFFYSVGTFIVVEYFEIEMTNYYALEHGIDVGENPRPFTMNVMRICVVAALLCSTDVVAAVSIVDYTKQPKLFSVIFGEGIVNDIVCIILFNTIVNLMSEDFTAGTLFTVLVQFILLGVVSLSIGAIFGFFTSWIFKHASFLRVNAITETFLIIAFSYISYFVSDFTVLAGIRMSGIISLLTCGIVQSHYTYYNLSPQGKIISTSTITFIAIAAEAGVYSYIGLSLYSNIASWWSFEFIIYETFIVIGGRYGAIYLCFALFNLCFKSRSISAKELLFIGWGGMIRGAVAFALVMRIPYIGAHNCNLAKADTECFETSDYEMIVTTTISLVIFTTLVFGTFMALLGKIVVPTPTTGTDEH